MCENVVRGKQLVDGRHVCGLDGKLHLRLDELDKAEQNAGQSRPFKGRGECQKGWYLPMNEETIGKGVPFERIRRITGYLTGSLNKWNDAKKAEERDRVKHTVPGNQTSNAKP